MYFGLSQLSPPHKSVSFWPQGSPEHRRVVRMPESQWTSEVRQSSLTWGQSMVAEMLMDGTLIPVGSTTNEKFQRDSNTKWDSSYHLFIFTSIYYAPTNCIRPRNTMLQTVNAVPILRANVKIIQSTLEVPILHANVKIIQSTLEQHRG